MFAGQLVPLFLMNTYGLYFYLNFFVFSGSYVKCRNIYYELCQDFYVPNPTLMYPSSRVEKHATGIFFLIKVKCYLSCCPKRKFTHECFCLAQPLLGNMPWDCYL